VLRLLLDVCADLAASAFSLTRRYVVTVPRVAAVCQQKISSAVVTAAWEVTVYDCRIPSSFSTEDSQKSSRACRRRTKAKSIAAGVPASAFIAFSKLPEFANLLGHSTSEITEMYYVKNDTARLEGISNWFEI
jgi:hypothetical protein